MVDRPFRWRLPLATVGLRRTPLGCSEAIGLAFGAALASLAPAAAQADTDTPMELPQVVVTARRIEENIQRVPITVTALDPVQIQQQHIETTADLMYNVPSLTVNPYFGIQFNSYSIRGLSSLNNGANTAVYFSESPCCAPNASIPFVDLASVEVLNGPQGTLFGRSSASGAVVLTPVHPDLERFGGFGGVTVGDYERVQSTGAVNVPLVPGHLAVRLSWGIDHLGGYTRAIGSDLKFDQRRDQTVRLGVELDEGAFDDYVAVDYINLHQAPTNAVLVGIDTTHGAGGLYNLPLGAASAVFGAVCAQAVTDGLASNVNGCVSQRYAILVGIKTALTAELARVSAGGGAIRSEPAPAGGNPAFLRFRDASVVNIARYRLLESDRFDVTLKDVFSFDASVNNTGYPSDGIGGLAEENGAQQTASYGSSNQMGANVVERLGPFTRTYNNDFQAHFSADQRLLTGVVGFFYTGYDEPATNLGTGSLYKLFGGVLTENLGYNAAAGFPAGGHGSETAVYTQNTLDLSRWIHGLKLTGGYRYSWDATYASFHPAEEDNVTGVFSPAAALSVSTAGSSGPNFTASVSEQATPDLMAYATVSRAYVPGGVNGQFGVIALPNYTPTYAPEAVVDAELGVKWDVRLGGVAARIDADVYNYDFSGIQEFFSGISNGVALNYIENIAAAKLKGFETNATLLPSKDWEIRVSYNYNSFHYKKWTGEDPLNIAQPGDPLCVPASPAGYCFLDLSKNPAAGMPNHQGHITVVYHAPIASTQGRVDIAATLYAQSRVYFPATAYRQLQISGPGALGSISQNAYALLNLRATWTGAGAGAWSASLFIDNVTDQIYKIGTTSQLAALGFATASYGPPRMIGAEVTRKF